MLNPKKKVAMLLMNLLAKKTPKKVNKEKDDENMNTLKI